MTFGECVASARMVAAGREIEGVGPGGAVLAVCPADEAQVDRLKRTFERQPELPVRFVGEYFLSYHG